MLVILVSWEAEITRLMVQGQPRQEEEEENKKGDPILKNTQHPKADGVA
jgi:hypothetical protein